MKFLVIVLAAFLTIGISYSQQLPLGSLYYANMVSINPAFVGHNDKMELFVAHRNQFVGFENSPKTNFMSLTGRVSNQHRIGLTAYSDATALFTKNIINANYGYSLNFGNQQQLVFALGAGLSTLDLDLSKGKAVDMNDQVYSALRQTKAGFNADFGLLYEIKNLQVGFSIPQLFNNATNFELGNNKLYTYKNTSHLRGTMKYDFSVGQKGMLTASPMVMVRSVKGAPLQYDLSAILDHRNWGWIGLTYHSDLAFAASVGFRYRNFTVGYAHDFITSDLQRFGRHSSEIILGYTFDKRKSTEPVEDLTDILDPKAAQVENNAPTDPELELMRQEIEKKRKEKLLESDTLQKKEIENAQAEENRLVEEAEKNAEKIEREKREKVEAEAEKIEAEKEVEEKKIEVEKKAEAEKKKVEAEKEEVEAEKKAEVEKEEVEAEEKKVEAEKEEVEAEKKAEVEKKAEAETEVEAEEKKIEVEEKARVEAEERIRVAKELDNPIAEVNKKTPLFFDDAANFKLANGTTPEEGFYIILGAFGDHSNTVRFMKALGMNGINNAFIVNNEIKNLEQVCVFFTGDIAGARNELLKFRAEGRKCWILNLK